MTLVVAATAGGRTDAPAAAPGTRTGAAEDVRLLAAELERIHPAPFHTVPRGELLARFESLAARAGSLTRDQLLVELMRATVLGPRDGHGGLYPFGAHATPLHLYPIRLWAFPEGYYVVASRSRPALVGLRLLSIGGTPVAEVAARVRPLISADNESSLLLRLPEFMITAEVLRGLGLVDDPARAALVFRRPNGTTLTTTLTPVAATAYVGAAVRQVEEFFTLPPPPRVRTPLWQQRPNSTQWVTTLARGRVVYAVYSMTIGSTFEFAEDLARRARRKGVRRVVIDVRRNGGGNNSTYGSLAQALRTGPLARRGLSVLLTSRITYSAASNFVGEVDARTRTRIVGEAAGGSPNNYGDRRQVELPSLGWTVYVAPQYVEVVRGDRRTEVRPDVPVALTARAYFAGRDPVLARAISLR
jgi:hypothetical protein